MQSFKTTFTAWAAVSAAVLGVTAASPSSQAAASSAPAAKASVAKTVTAAAAVAALKPAKPPAIGLAAAAARQPAARAVSPDGVRSMIKYQTVRWGGKPVQTLAEESRIALAKAAAEKAGLREVGLSFHDVYGVIEAETSWIPRTGSSKNGTPNLGLAQFEPRTARGLGVKDPSDPVQAVFGAAMYIKEGAEWAHGKLRPLKLSPDQHAAKVREGVSVYYNLSIKGRNKWDGFNTAKLPVETQRHIRNARAGAAEAAQLVKQLSI